MTAGALGGTSAAAGRAPVRGSAAGTLAVAGLTGCTWVGAVRASEVSLWLPVGLGLAVVIAALRWQVAPLSGGSRGRRPAGRGLLLVAAGGIAVGLLASALAADAWAGLDQPIPSRLDGRVELVGDPRPTRFGVRVEVRGEGRLWDVTADGEAAGFLRGLRAGESVVVEATTRPRDPDDRWRASRHVAGTAAVTVATSAEPAWGPWRVANAIHRALLRSTQHLTPDVRGVALGVALGDRGAIDELLAEDLRAAGLSHLTAVSGQHVALLVGMATPLLSRLTARTAVVATLALLAGFVILTRGEPSVLRAAAMAVVVTVVRARGRRAVALRVLAVVVTVLVLVDPMLVWSVGFQLSVAATVGIAVGAARLGAAIPGPRPVAAALGVSLAAQLAVTPLVIAHFGVMPLVGLFANLAVVPTIGPLMGWTLGAGLAGGLVPTLAEVIHVPTAVLAGWVVWVAEWSAGLGVPGLRLPAPGGHVMVGAGVVAALTALGWWMLRGRPASRRWMLAILMGAALVAAGVAGSGRGALPAGRHELGVGAEVVVGGGQAILIVDGRAAPGMVVGGLRRLGVGTIDVLVARSPSASSVAVVEAVAQRVAVAGILAPGRTPLEGVTVVDRRQVLVVGALEVMVSPGDGDRLDVVVGGPV